MEISGPCERLDYHSAFTRSLLAVWFLVVIHVLSILRLVEDLFTHEPFFAFVVSVSQS